MQDNVVYEYDDFYFLMEPQQVCSILSLCLLQRDILSNKFRKHAGKIICFYAVTFIEARFDTWDQI